MFQHLAGLRANSEVQEKLFLIVINIQKKQTICFQITGMPSLSFLYNICTRRMAGEPSGRAARWCEHNELTQDGFSAKECKGWKRLPQRGQTHCELLTSFKAERTSCDGSAPKSDAPPKHSPNQKRPRGQQALHGLREGEIKLVDLKGTIRTKPHKHVFPPT